MISDTQSNFHCSVIEINQTGIMITGSSGSGKTSLALGLLERANSHQLLSAFISDDQAILREHNSRLVAKTPPTIAGKLELHGYGIIDLPYKKETTIDLVIEMCPEDTLDRMPEERFTTINNVQLPLLRVPIKHEAQSVRIVFAWLHETFGIGPRLGLVNENS